MLKKNTISLISFIHFIHFISSFNLCKSLKYGGQKQELFASIIIVCFEKASTQTNPLKTHEEKEGSG